MSLIRDDCDLVEMMLIVWESHSKDI